MPIRPENRARYPKDWKAISERVRARDGNRCKRCRLPNGAWGWRDADGTFHRVSKAAIRDTFLRDERFTRRPPFMLGVAGIGTVKVIEIVLTVAHLDHTPENCDPTNLEALCQRCHLALDHEHHQANARSTRAALRRGKAHADLFGESQT